MSLVINVDAYLPLGVAVTGLTTLLIAATWSARTAILVRLLDSQLDTSQRLLPRREISPSAIRS